MEFLPLGFIEAFQSSDWQSVGWVGLMFALVIGHALADFPLQGEFLAIGKERGNGLSKVTGMEWPRTIWIYCLVMHSAIHGGAVWLITGSMTFGLIELGLHFMIDFAKSCKWTNFYVDQGLHITCKVVYVVVIFQAGS